MVAPQAKGYKSEIVKCHTAHARSRRTSALAERAEGGCDRATSCEGEPPAA